MKIVLENLVSWYENMILAAPPYVGTDLVSAYKHRWPIIENFAPRYGRGPAKLSLENIKQDWLLTRPSAPLLAFAVPSDWRRVVRIVSVAGSIVAAIAVVRGYASPSELFVAYLAALTVGGALLVALTSVFILRYATPLDPLVLIAVIVGAPAALVRCAAVTRRIPRLARSREG